MEGSGKQGQSAAGMQGTRDRGDHGERGPGTEGTRGAGKTCTPLVVLTAPLHITCQLLRKPCCSPCAVLLQAKLIISNEPMFKLQNQAGASCFEGFSLH